MVRGAHDECGFLLDVINHKWKLSPLGSALHTEPTGWNGAQTHDSRRCCCTCYVCLPPSPPPQSDLVKVFVGRGAAPHEVSRISSVGTKAHGLVAWGRRGLLMLDSEYGALVSVDVATGNVYDIWVVRLKTQGVEVWGEGCAAALCRVQQLLWKLGASSNTSLSQGLRMTVFCEGLNKLKQHTQTQVGARKVVKPALSYVCVCVSRVSVCKHLHMHVQVSEEGKFLKGLAVLDDIAYFGITTWANRSVRDRCVDQSQSRQLLLVSEPAL